MRCCFLLALAGCVGSYEDDFECPDQLVSDVQSNAGRITSGQHAAAVTWTRQIRVGVPERHGMMVFADGTVTPDIAVDGFEARGVPGTHTVVWLQDPRDHEEFEVTLARTDGTFLRMVLAPLAQGRAATFDGTSYQLFWSTQSGVQHVSLSEDGVFGAIHQLTATPTDEILPASDDAGTTLVRIGDAAHFVDSANGALTHVLDGAETVEQVFSFAGKFYLHDGAELIVVTPPGAVARRPLTDQLANATEFYATPNKLLAESSSGVFDVDANLAVTGQVAGQVSFEQRIGLVGTALVEQRHFGLDFVTGDPGHVDLMGPGWRVQLTVDSPVRSLCDAR